MVVSFIQQLQQERYYRVQPQLVRCFNQELVRHRLEVLQLFRLQLLALAQFYEPTAQTG